MSHSLLIRIGATALFLAAGAVADDAVARVGDRVITRRVLDTEVQQALNARYYHGSLPADKRLALEREVLAGLIRRQLDVLGGLDGGLRLDVAAARTERAAIERRAGAQVYERSLAALGWDRRAHVQALAETHLADEATRRFVQEPARVSDADVRAAYQADPGRWTIPESLHLEHILLAVAPGADKARWQVREGEARRLVERLRAGEPFAALAEKASDAPHRVKGGDLGWVHRGRLVEPVESAVWRAKVGELVGPLRGAEGIHIAMVLARRPARAMTYEEAVPRLRAELEQAALARAQAAWFAAVRTRHPVVILDAKLAEAAGGA